MSHLLRLPVVKGVMVGISLTHGRQPVLEVATVVVVMNMIFPSEGLLPTVGQKHPYPNGLHVIARIKPALLFRSAFVHRFVQSTIPFKINTYRRAQVISNSVKERRL